MEDALSVGRLRKAAPADAFTMSKLVLSCGMNPRLGDMSNFIVYENSDGVVVGGGQVRPGDPGELASLAVKAPWRGRGIGTAIAEALVEREGAHRDICLLCLSRAVDFYGRLGFCLCESASELPFRMLAEQKIGTVVASFVAPGNKVVGMIRKVER
jgi:N-acetylglutamate synthase-like GNAT family acetyltransferase